jgi:hypothetical protein
LFTRGSFFTIIIIIMTEDNAYLAFENDDNAPLDAMFTANHAESERIVEARQQERGAREGDLTMAGTFVAYLVKDKSDGSAFGRNTSSAVPPDTQTKTVQTGDRKGSTYPAAIPVTFRIQTLTPLPNVCVERTDGRPGWRVLGKIKYFESGLKFLQQRAPAAWTPDPTTKELPSDTLSVRVREYMSADSIKVSHKWFNISPGDEVKAKVADSKGNIFREKTPDKSSLLVQPSTPMKLQRVSYEVYVNASEFDVEDAGQEEVKEETAAAVAAAGATDGDAKPKKKTHKEYRIMAYPAFECRGNAIISEDYDSNKTLSERKHESENPNAHNMVPIVEWMHGRAEPPSSVYFYVRNGQTPYNETDEPTKRGVSIVRYSDKDSSDFMSEFESVKRPVCQIRFDVYQWMGRPHANERYVVQIKHAVKNSPDADKFWRSYGITDMVPYALIVGANPRLPVHVNAKLWEKQTRQKPSNALEELGATPGNVAKHVDNVCGYYVYGMTELVVDFLRFFRSGGNALRISAERVESEFSEWESVVKRTGRKEIKLAAADGTKANPINFKGLASPVIALGNGQPTAPGSGLGLYHAFTGDIVPLFAGQHEFYVLTSHALTDEERAAHCSKRLSDAYADAFLDSLITKEGVHYWIYAVRKDAKMAGQRHRATAEVVPATPKQAPTGPLPVVAIKAAAPIAVAPKKRERADEDETTVAEKTKRPALIEEEEDEEGNDEEEEMEAMRDAYGA